MFIAVTRRFVVLVGGVLAMPVPAHAAGARRNMSASMRVVRTTTQRRMSGKDEARDNANQLANHCGIH